ncbi:hypothetical protein [Nonomuraea sp. JJY05]|uniref:hypothetical protein n=1 Tax=Nonomuraea sp. JJY05 TaxID=3350255 RepID=UPI00373E6E94
MPPANGYNHAVVASGPRGEQTVTAAKRLTKAAAHKLIGAPGRHLTPSVLSAVLAVLAVLAVIAVIAVLAVLVVLAVLAVIESGRVRVAQRAQGAARRLVGVKPRRCPPRRSAIEVDGPAQ